MEASDGARGHLAVCIRHCILRSHTAASDEPVIEGGCVWVSITVVGAAKRLFRVENDAPQSVFEATSDATTLIASPSSPSVGTCWKANPQCCLQSASINVDECDFGDLARSEAVFTVRFAPSAGAVTGNKQEAPPADAVVLGTVAVPLASVLDGRNEWESNVALGEPRDARSGTAGFPTTWLDASASTVAVTITTNDAFADFALGGVVLRPVSASVTGLHTSWEVGQPFPGSNASDGVPASSVAAGGQEATAAQKLEMWEAGVVAALAGAAGQKVSYSLSWPAAVASTAAAPLPGDGIGSAADGPRVVKGGSDSGSSCCGEELRAVRARLSHGKLTYRPAPVERRDTSSDGDGGGDTASLGADCSFGPRKGVWSVEFDGAQCTAASVFLHRSSVRRLLLALRGGSLLPVLFERIPAVVKVAEEASLMVKGGKGAAGANAGAKGGGGGGTGKGGAKVAAAVEEEDAGPPEVAWHLSGRLDLAAFASEPGLTALDLSAKLSPMQPLAASTPGSTGTEQGQHTTAAAAVAATPGAMPGASSQQQAQCGPVAVPPPPPLTTLSLKLVLSRPLLPLPQGPGRAAVLAEILPPLPPTKTAEMPRHDISAEIRGELGSLITEAASSYISVASLDGLPAGGYNMDNRAGGWKNGPGSAALLQDRLLEALASAGVLVAFKERLAPQIAAAAAEAFPQRAEGAQGAAEMAVQLYDLVSAEAHASLNAKIQAAREEVVTRAAGSAMTYSSTISAATPAALAALAASAEAAGDWTAAAAHYQECLTANAGGGTMVVGATPAPPPPWRPWENYAGYLARRSRPAAAAAGYKMACRLCRAAVDAAGEGATDGDGGSGSSAKTAAFECCDLLVRYGCTLLECGRDSKALAVLEAARDFALTAYGDRPAVGGNVGGSGGGGGGGGGGSRGGIGGDGGGSSDGIAAQWGNGGEDYDSDEAAERCPALLLSLLCVAHHACGHKQEARRALAAAVKAGRASDASVDYADGGERGFFRPTSFTSKSGATDLPDAAASAIAGAPTWESGIKAVECAGSGVFVGVAPRRTAVALMQAACGWLLELSLTATAGRALAVAQLAEDAVAAKVKRRGLPQGCPPLLRAGFRLLRSRLARAAGDGTAAAEAAADTVDLLATTAPASADGADIAAVAAATAAAKRRARAHLAHAEARDGQKDAVRACGAYAAAAAALLFCDGGGHVGGSCDGHRSAHPLVPLMETAAPVDGPLLGCWEVPLSVAARLGLRLRLGSLLMGQGKLEAARQVYLDAVKDSCHPESQRGGWSAPAPFNSMDAWLGVGVASLRLELWQDAEAALQTATRIDPTRPAPWGYLALLLLFMTAAIDGVSEAGNNENAAAAAAGAVATIGAPGSDSGGGRGGAGPAGPAAPRLLEAEAMLRQALRLGLTDPALLRELACALVALGRLPPAEDLLRRSLSATGGREKDGAGGSNASNDDGNVNGGVGSGFGRGGFGGGGGGNAGSSLHTRRLLADVLSAQMAVAQAVREYTIVILDSEASHQDRDAAWVACVGLLRSVGREDEMQRIAAQLAVQPVAAVGEAEAASGAFSGGSLATGVLIGTSDTPAGG